LQETDTESAPAGSPCRLDFRAETRLPPALVRGLLDVAIALREEADRRQRG
jgi:hypothetical protein